MAASKGVPRPNSGAGWVVPSAALLGRPHVSEQAARASLIALDMIESWLAASRQMVDLWRTTVRDMQDGVLTSYRQQVANILAHDLLEELEGAEATSTKRGPVTRTALAKASVAQTE